MQSRPTHVRWGILCLLMGFTGLCHFNRTSISVAGTERLMEQYDISETTMGTIYTSYLLVYTICMIPGGWLIDRAGPKRALLLLGVSSALLIPLTGLAGMFAANIVVTLYAVRALLGVASVPTHPGTARAVSFWFPAQSRSLANGLLTGAALVGIASTFYVFGTMMDYFGWEMAFIISGAVTMLLAIAWAIFGADHPAQHPGVNAAELRLIEPSIPVAPDRDVDSVENMIPARQLPEGRRKLSLTMLTLSYAMYSYLQYLSFYWMEHYFKDVLQLPVSEARLYTTITMVSMALGMVFGGRIADILQQQFPGWLGRSLTPMIGLAAAAAFLMVGLADQASGWVVTCFSIALASLGACESSFWVAGISLGRERGGLYAAILNTGGNAGGLPAPVCAPLISEHFGWSASLAVASALCLVGAVCWLWVELDSDVETESPTTLNDLLMNPAPKDMLAP